MQTGIAASCHHAVAMTIQDLDTIIRWSEEVVPPNLTQADQTGSMQMPLVFGSLVTEPEKNCSRTGL